MALLVLNVIIRQATVQYSILYTFFQYSVIMCVINYPHVCYCVLLHIIHILYGIIKQIVHETIILLLFIG